MFRRSNKNKIIHHFSVVEGIQISDLQLKLQFGFQSFNFVKRFILVVVISVQVQFKTNVMEKWHKIGYRTG